MGHDAFVLGNAAWDETLRLAALPAPGASVHVRRGASGPGGKGFNQAVVLARAGAPTTLATAIGADAAGDRLAGALAAEGLRTVLIRREGLATDWSAVLVSETGENAILTATDAAQSLDAADVCDALVGAVAGDLCVLQGNFTSEATLAAVAEAQRRGMVVAFNPSPVDAGLACLISRADAVFLNRDEAQVFAGGVDAAALRALGASRIIVTLGKDGALLLTQEHVAHVPAVSATSVDPTGAGDVFLAATLAAARGRGWRPGPADVAAGAAAAALSVAREGAFAGLPTREELAAIIGPT